MEFIKKMWKIFLIGIACIVPMVWGQYDNYEPYYGQTTSQTSMMSYQQHVVTSASGKATEELLNYTYTKTHQSPSTFNPLPTVQTKNFPKQLPASVPQSPPSPPIVFPDNLDDTEIPSESFSTKLFEIVSEASANQNMLFSPMSLQTMLSFIYTFSDGKLAIELANLLELPKNRTQVAQKFQAITSNLHSRNVNNTLIMTNKFYYEQRFGNVNQNIRILAANSFAADVEPLDFLAPQQASDVINTWIDEKTRHLIKHIITPDSLKADTRAVLINSLYFKSEWQQKFSPYDTDKQPFYLSQQRQVPVDMMYIEDIFQYGVFDDLQAKVIELPYKLDDFRMMIILPNEIEGLREVEKRLTKTTLKSISERLQNTEVTVKLPQFNIEFEGDYVQAMQQLGLFALFNDEAQIKLFENQYKPIHVDQIKQKTYISVNEAGTEAAAVTFAKFVPLSIPLRVKSFTADHPFIFVIRNSMAAYFMGHVVHFNDQN